MDRITILDTSAWSKRREREEVVLDEQRSVADAYLAYLATFLDEWKSAEDAKAYDDL